MLDSDWKNLSQSDKNDHLRALDIIRAYCKRMGIPAKVCEAHSCPKKFMGRFFLTTRSAPIAYIGSHFFVSYENGLYCVVQQHPRNDSFRRCVIGSIETVSVLDMAKVIRNYWECFAELYEGVEGVSMGQQPYPSVSQQVIESARECPLTARECVTVPYDVMLDKNINNYGNGLRFDVSEERKPVAPAIRLTRSPFVQS